jgi:beta-glucosidase
LPIRPILRDIFAALSARARWNSPGAKTDKTESKDRNIVFAVFFGLLAQAQAQQDSVEDRVEGILNRMTLDEKLAYITGVGFDFATFGTYPGVFNIKGDERLSAELGHPVNLGLPEIYGSDGSIGITGQGTPPGTRYPAGMLLASTWNAESAYKEGVAQGREARARGLHRILGPAVNFYLTPFNGRSFEYMTGEDPFLGAVLMAAEIRGIQSQGVMATAKHFVCNDEEVNRYFINVLADERTLREIYLPPFEAAVKLVDVAAILASYNKINGDWACESHFLLTEVLKQDWGFRGFVESDFGALHDGLKAAKAGTDIEMPGNLTFVNANPLTIEFGGQMTPEKLSPAIASGELSIDNINDKVRRMLRQIVSFGFLDRPQLDPSIPVNDPKSKEAATDIAREGIVLLENKRDLLPLDKRAVRRIAVIGANAKGVPPSGGGSAAVPVSVDFVSEMDGIKSMAKQATVDYIAACVPDPSTAVWQTGGSAGLEGKYYNSPDLTGNPVATRVDTHLNFGSFNTSNVPVSNPSSFSGIWTGKVTPTVSGDHVFKVFLATNVKLWVNNQKIVDTMNPVGTPDTPLSATTPFVPISGKIINLRAGVAYDVRLEAVNLGTGPNPFYPNGLQLSWASLQPPADLARYDVVVLAVGGNDQYDGETHDRSSLSILSDTGCRTRNSATRISKSTPWF